MLTRERELKRAHIRSVLPSAWVLCAVCVMGSCAASLAPVDPDAGPRFDAGPPGARFDAGPPNDSCLHVATAWCNKLDACTSGLGVAAYFPDAPTCVARYADLCMRTLAAPGTTVTPALDDTCADAYAAQDCDQFRAGFEPDGCVPPPGTRPNGAPCVADGQCQSTVCRVPTSGMSQCGVCAPQPADGDSCADLSCGRNLRCVENRYVSQYACRRPRMVGEVCTRGIPCMDGNSCWFPYGSETGQCRRSRAVAGEGCSYGVEACLYEVGLACRDDTRTCTPGTPATAGMRCFGDAAGWENYTYCTQGALCSDPTLQAGTCVAPAADWNQCQPGRQQACLRPFRCQRYVSNVSPELTGLCVTLDPTACD